MEPLDGYLGYYTDNWGNWHTKNQFGGFTPVSADERASVERGTFQNSPLPTSMDEITNLISTGITSAMSPFQESISQLQGAWSDWQEAYGMGHAGRGTSSGNQGLGLNDIQGALALSFPQLFNEFIDANPNIFNPTYSPEFTVTPPDVTVTSPDGGFSNEAFTRAFTEFLGNEDNVNTFRDAFNFPEELTPEAFGSMFRNFWDDEENADIFSPEINVEPPDVTVQPTKVSGGFGPEEFEAAFRTFLQEPGNVQLFENALSLPDFSPDITVEGPETTGLFSDDAFAEAFSNYISEHGDVFSPNISVESGPVNLSGGFSDQAFGDAFRRFFEDPANITQFRGAVGGLTAGEIDEAIEGYFGPEGAGANIFSDAVSNYQSPDITVASHGGFGTDEFADAFRAYLDDPTNVTQFTAALGLPDFSPEINVQGGFDPDAYWQQMRTFMDNRVPTGEVGGSPVDAIAPGGMTSEEFGLMMGNMFSPGGIGWNAMESLIPDYEPSILEGGFDPDAYWQRMQEFMDNRDWSDVGGGDVTVQGGFDPNTYWQNMQDFMDNRDWGDIGGGDVTVQGGFDPDSYWQTMTDFMNNRDWSDARGGGGDVTVQGGLTPEEMQQGLHGYFGQGGLGYEMLQNLIPEYPEPQNQLAISDIENWWAGREALAEPEVERNWQQEMLDFFSPGGLGSDLIPEQMNWQDEFETYFGPEGPGEGWFPEDTGGTVVNVNTGDGTGSSGFQDQLDDLENRWNTWHDDFGVWQEGLPTDITDQFESLGWGWPGGGGEWGPESWPPYEKNKLLLGEDEGSIESILKKILPLDTEEGWSQWFREVMGTIPWTDPWDLSAEEEAVEGGGEGGAGEVAGAGPYDPWSGEVYSDEFTGLEMPAITDYTDALRLPAINEALSGLSAPSPWDTRRDEYLQGAMAPLQRSYDDARERLISTGGVLNKLGTPGFRAQLGELEEARAAEEGRIGSQFAMEAARSDEGYRRDRLGDVTNLLGEEFDRTQSQIKLQDALNRGAMEDYYNQLNQWRTGYMAPDAYADAGINFGLGGIGSLMNTSAFGSDSLAGTSAAGTNAQNNIAANRIFMNDLFSGIGDLLWKQEDEN